MQALGPASRGLPPLRQFPARRLRALLRDLPPPSPSPHPQSRDTGKNTAPPPQSQIRAQAPRKVNMAVTMTRSSLTRFWRTLYKSSSASTPTRGAIPRKAHKNQGLQSGTSQARQLNLFPRHWSRPLPPQGGLPLRQHRSLPTQGEETWWKKLHQTGYSQSYLGLRHLGLFGGYPQSKQVQRGLFQHQNMDLR